MEKIKDILHDFSDVFLAIVIASLMFIVVGSSLGSWFNTSTNSVLADGLTELEREEDTDSSTVSENGDKVGEKEIKNGQNESNKDPKQNSSNESLSDEKETAPVVDSEIKTITIPNGTPSSGIAKILKENELIEDTKDFIQTAENLNLSVRLKSGTFNIPVNASIEDMVQIIAGKKK